MIMSEITFTVSQSCGKAARIGLLTLQGTPHRTPLLMVSTLRGTVPHLTPDTFHRTLVPKDYVGLLVHIEAMLEDSWVIPRTTPRSLDELVGYGASVFVACNEPDYYYHDHSSPQGMKNGPDWVSINSVAGIVPFHIKASFPLLWSGLRPAGLLVPTDHYPIHTSRLKRIRKSTDASRHYWEIATGLEDIQTTLFPSLCLHSESAEAGEKKVLVRNEMERRLHSVADSRSGMLAIVCDDASATDIATIHPHNAIYVRGSLSPEQIVHYFHAGADIFDSVYATDKATKNIALLITKVGSFEEVALEDERHFEDFFPLDVTCGCIACAGPDKTTKAYLHHLVRTTEMLANVYLASHNLWQYARLLDNLRQYESTGEVIE